MLKSELRHQPVMTFSSVVAPFSPFHSQDGLTLPDIYHGETLDLGQFQGAFWV
jgi:hypothetical protein